MSSICLIIAHLVTSGVNAGEASFDRGPYRQGIVDPIVSSRGIAHIAEWADRNDDPRWRLLSGRTPRGGVDCTGVLRRMRAKIMEPSAASRPESMARIAFDPVYVSQNGRVALVIWHYYYHPLNAGGHYALMAKMRGKWIVVENHVYGPIS